MAKITLNPMFDELHGKFGDIVYRESYGNLLMSRNPKMKGVVPSARQLAQRERFRQAAVYAQAAFAEEPVRQLYAPIADQRLKPILAVMIADFLHGPSIDELDVSHYEGRIGSPIYVWARDDFAVQTVQVKIVDSNGELRESGFAAVEPGVERWKYMGQMDLPSGISLCIQVLVTDRPGNMASKEAAKTV